MKLRSQVTLKRPFPSMRTAPNRRRNTDLVRFSDGDFVCGEADIKDENEDGCEEMESEGGGFENEDCSDCPYFCPVCGECMYEGED